jgi:hypothetical protein
VRSRYAFRLEDLHAIHLVGELSRLRPQGHHSRCDAPNNREVGNFATLPGKPRGTAIEGQERRAPEPNSRYPWNQKTVSRGPRDYPLDCPRPPPPVGEGERPDQNGLVAPHPAISGTARTIVKGRRSAESLQDA